MNSAIQLAEPAATGYGPVTFGVCATCDPRIDPSARERAVNIVRTLADIIAEGVTLAEFVASASNPTWPHTWVVPKYASMGEYKQYAPANHFHMTWGLAPARLQYWMDLANVLSVAPWRDRPAFIEGMDRPQPLMDLIGGGEVAAKRLRAGR